MTSLSKVVQIERCQILERYSGLLKVLKWRVTVHCDGLSYQLFYPQDKIFINFAQICRHS